MERQYLTDEELNSLIATIEDGDMAVANPDILSGILEKIETKDLGEIQSESVPKITENADKIKKPPKNKEFILYCFKVGTAVAAAVAVIIIIPEVTRFLPGGKVLTKEEVLQKESYMTRQEAIDSVSRESSVTISVFTKDEWTNLLDIKEN